MNSYTKTPVNSVWYDAGLALSLGLLSFAGTQAVNAVFAISTTGLYIAYSIPIVARFLGDNDFKPGPFNLGIFASTFLAKMSEVANLVFTESTGWHNICLVHGFSQHRISLPFDPDSHCADYELHGRRPRRCNDSIACVVLLPQVRRSSLVYGSDIEHRAIKGGYAEWI